MRIPHALQGVILFPPIVGLIFILKAFCPESSDGTCFADYFATPIFLPLIAIYRIFGGEAAGMGQELLFIFLYWGTIGFLVGFILDILAKRDPYTPPSQYLPEQYPPL